MSLEIQNLNVSIEGKPILKDFSLKLPQGEVHALMGPNGAGKSTLAKVLAGHADYQASSGSAQLDKVELLGKEPEEIAKLGLFLAFQYPMEIPGVSIANFLRAALKAQSGDNEKFSAKNFYADLRKEMDKLNIDRSFTARSLNEGFSGGEKKRCEILQMAVLKPRLCVLDETDSGLDIDALKIVSEGVNQLKCPQRSFLIITHYQRLLNYIVPDKVHIMDKGCVVKTGGPNLAKDLEEKGYEYLKQPA